MCRRQTLQILLPSIPAHLIIIIHLLMLRHDPQTWHRVAQLRNLVIQIIAVALLDHVVRGLLAPAAGGGIGFVGGGVFEIVRVLVELLVVGG